MVIYAFNQFTQFEIKFHFTKWFTHAIRLENSCICMFNDWHNQTFTCCISKVILYKWVIFDI